MLGNAAIVFSNRLLDCPGSPQEAGRSKRDITIAAAGFHLASSAAGPNEADPQPQVRATCLSIASKFGRRLPIKE